MKRTLVALALLALLAQQPATPQALPIANFAMNRAIASVITRIAASRGFAANDARVIATLDAISSSSTALNVVSTGAGIGLSLAGAPVWLTILAGLGIVSAGSHLIATLGDAQVAIGQTYDGSVALVSKLPRKEAVTLPSYPSFETSPAEEPLFEMLRRLGARVYRTDGCSPTNTRVACHEFPLLPQASTGIALSYPEHGIRIPFTSISELEELRTRWLFQPGDPDPQLKIIELLDGYGEFAGFAERMWTNKHRTCSADTPPFCPAPLEWVTLELDPAAFEISRDAFYGLNRVTTESIYPDLDAARAGVNQELLRMPISPKTLTDIVDESWQQAAEAPDYAGLPYRDSEPVTEEDVVIWVKENPKEVPHIGDIFEPANPPDIKTVPISPRIRPREDPSPQVDPETDPRVKPRPDPEIDPNTARDPDEEVQPGSNRNKNTEGVKDVNVVNRPTVDIGNRVKVDMDLGSAPEVSKPALEKTPTAKMIIDPILGLTSDFKAWTMPSHSAACPRTTFQAFDRTIPIDAHCEIAESIGPQLRQVMIAAFAVMALLIVLSA
ncbi:hypothetical protein PHO31112_05384 [Pandoraea horticolens]|uniref:Transmembrane protein n=1 Tax=Pandoraea horticolens TaxID=2508298 RepID=A0A5E4ZDP8_9BURK|nr:IgG-binding virulence factor TspB family protein [Pandoraea horticolens]VVE58807.1 hypothetical protein PHO31112_05384 [Pandoraea horticolens]